MKAQKAETQVASEAEMFSEVNLRITLICVTDGCSLANVQGWSNAQLLCLTVCVKCSMLSQRTKTWCGETSLVSQQNRNHLITAELIFKSLIYIFLLSAKISFHHGGILTIPLDEKQMVPLQHHSLKYQAFVPKPKSSSQKSVFHVGYLILTEPLFQSSIPITKKDALVNNWDCLGLCNQQFKMSTWFSCVNQSGWFSCVNQSGWFSCVNQPGVSAVLINQDVRPPCWPVCRVVVLSGHNTLKRRHAVLCSALVITAYITDSNFNHSNSANS